jgi:HSP20 family protein
MFVLPLVLPRTRRVHLCPEPRQAARDEASRDDAPPAAVAARVPAMDVAESEAAFTLTFDLPGLARDEVQVSVEGRSVSIAAAPAAQDAAPATAVRLLRRERATPRYARKLLLPADLDPAGATARFENGVLTLTLAKKQPDGARRVTVQ